MPKPPGAKRSRTADASPAHSSLLHNAARLIGLRLDAFMAYESYLASPDSVYELHEMRIAAKRLRYTMEIFQDAYTLHTNAGAEFTQALEAVKAMQEHLGALHDADVLVPRLLEHLGRVLRDGYGMPLPVAHTTTPTPPDDLDRPIAGVHRVDYDACRGLLDLCTRSRDDRDARYAQMLDAWRAIRETQQLDRLRRLLAGEGTGENRETENRKPETDQEPQPPEEDARTGSVVLALASPLPNPKESDAYDAANKQSPQVQRAPGEPGHIAAGRRRAAEPARESSREAGADGKRNSRSGKPKAQQADSGSDRRSAGTSDAVSGDTANGAGDGTPGGSPDGAQGRRDGDAVLRDARRENRAGRGKNARRKDGAGRNAPARSAPRPADAARPARSARSRPDTDTRP